MPALECPQDPSLTGAYRIAWTEEDDIVGEVTDSLGEAARGDAGEKPTWRLTENGELLYEGPDMASTVTGREAGTYAYELSHDGAVLDRCEVVVDPPSLATAFGMLGAGALVFVATLVVVLKGHKAHRAGRIG